MCLVTEWLTDWTNYVVFISIAGVFLFIVIYDVVQTYAGVALWELIIFLAGAKFLLIVVSKHVGVRKR